MIGDNVFIGPGAKLIEDIWPRSGVPTVDPRPPVLQEHCSIGAGAVIMPGVTIGKYTMVGAGAVVLEDTSNHCTVYGVPAKSFHTDQVDKKDNGDEHQDAHHAVVHHA